MSSCCAPKPETPPKSSCCPSDNKKTDYLFILSASFVGIFYGLYLISQMFALDLYYLKHYAHAVFDLMNKMWAGIFIGAFAVGILNFIPSSFIQKVLCKGGRTEGLFRATFAGVLLDLCSHGILMVGMKLYKKGLSIGQTMAFLIASPWNSLSLTIILASMIGVKWTLLFILFSMIVAFITGYIFDLLVDQGRLPKNPASFEQSEDVSIKDAFKKIPLKPVAFIEKVLFQGLMDSKAIIKWLFIGIVIASSLRVFLSLEQYQSYFGANMLGLIITVVFASIMEVCSEGSSPIAGDIFNKAGSAGNAFAFLMTGVSTDYTEIMTLKESTSSWKIALFLPLISLPQILFIGYLINTFR